MLKECPTCGNEIFVKAHDDKEKGWCKYCKRDYLIKRIKKKNKIFLELKEVEKDEACK